MSSDQDEVKALLASIVSQLARLEASQQKQFDELRAELRLVTKKGREDTKGPKRHEKDKERESKDKDLERDAEAQGVDASTSSSPSTSTNQVPPSVSASPRLFELPPPTSTPTSTPIKAINKTSHKKYDALEGSPDSVDTVAARKSDPKLLKKSEMRSKERDTGSLSDNGEDSSSRSPRRRPGKKTTAKISGDILDEAADDAVEEREIDETLGQPQGGDSASLSPLRRQRPASVSFIPQADTRVFESFQDDEDITVSEDEAFQQAWVELENQRQRKITSLGPKDIEKLLAITNQKLKEQRIEPEVKVTEKQERRKAKHKQKFLVTTKYKGPHIPEKIVPETIELLITAFQKQEKLHYKHAWSLITDCSAIFEKEPNLIELDLPRDGRIVVVGDTHGQLLDLITILRKAGMPSEKNIYIVNGDFVDRGPQGADVMFILFALKIMLPNAIYLHRGNHEEKRINRLYNFETQIRASYDAKMFDHIHSCFIHLPLGSLVEKKLLIVHGGLPKEEGLTLDEIKKIDRHRELPKPEECTSRELKIFEGLLWSDPVENTDEWLESNRGAGVYWGKNITKAFMSANSLDLLIRSHQLCNTGRKFNHLKFVMTIFSASYYCGINNNKGAVALFDAENGIKSPKFIEYYSEVYHPQNGSLKQKRETLQKIRSRIYKKRRKLYEAFSTFDPERSGYITRKPWIKAMARVLKLPLLWGKIFPYLVVPSPDGRIQYIEFLDRFKIDVGEDGRKWNRMIARKLVDKIRATSATLRQTFDDYSPKNSDGSISYAALVNILHAYGFGVSKTMLYDFVRRLDKNKDAKIDVDEYVAALGPHFDNAVSPGDLPWIKAELKSLARVIGSSKNLKDAFKHANKKTPDTLNFKAFSKYLNELASASTSEPQPQPAHDQPPPLPQYTDQQKHKLFSYMDLTESDLIYFEDMESAIFGSDFLPTQPSRNILADDVWALLHRRRYLLRDLFRHVDEDATGTVDAAEFHAGLEAFNEANGSVLSASQIEQLTSYAQKDEEGGVNYEKFISAIHVVDVGDELQPEAATRREESGEEPDGASGEGEAADTDVLM